MPEYLAPGVYVEEVNTGSKPIEGVSTSTAGILGVTERGPTDIPVLVTSFGDYRRVFGEHVDIEQFVDSLGHPHCYLSHAVDGFFTNGGKRAWIVRVAPEDATRAERGLFFADAALATPGETVLLRPAEQGTGTVLNGPPLFVLSRANISASKKDIVRIGDGSGAEYHEVDDDALPARHVSAHQPLQRAYPLGTATDAVTHKLDTLHYAGVFSLTASAQPGAGEVLVTGSVPDLGKLGVLPEPPTFPGPPNFGAVFQVGSGPAAEYIRATAERALTLPSGDVRVRFSPPLQRVHDKGDLVQPLELSSADSQPLAINSSLGDSLICLVAAGTAYTLTSNLVVVDTGNPDQEIRRIGSISELDLDRQTYELYPAGSIVERVTASDDTRSITAANPGLTEFTLADVSSILTGMTLVFLPAVQSRVVSAVDSSAKSVTVSVVPAGQTDVLVQPRRLTADASIGAVVIQLDNRLGLRAGDVLRVGSVPDLEFVTVRQTTEPKGAPPDAGAIVLAEALRLQHPTGTDVQQQTTPEVDATGPATRLLLTAAEGQDRILVNDGTGFAAGDVVRVVTPSGVVRYHQLDSGLAVVPATPGEITLSKSLERSHASGEPVVEREPLLTVHALDVGSWGNRVLVSTASEVDGLLARAEVNAATPSLGPGTFSTLRLTTATGVEAGTVLELLDSDGVAVIGALLKVRHVDRAAGNLITLDPPGLTAVQIAAHAAAIGTGERLVVRSREFRLEALVLAPPNAAIPTRNEDIADREVFRHLSMDPRHSRYVERTVGSTWTDGSATDDLDRLLRRWDRRSEGASQYLRVHDLGVDDADRERVRLGPEALVDVLPSGLVRQARHRLGEGEDSSVRGDDSMTTLTDGDYSGADATEPELRTGLFTFKNVPSISLVAAPGQTSVRVQQALIDHCEEQRYRFAVLDAQGPSADTLADVQAQRQQFDTKYAALYHPWLTIPDPFPDNLATIAQFPLPPSGHVLGIYARTDIERGVHKAPANEVVRGIVGLARYLNNGEHDILNAYPVHIDVIRDFRPNNRGIRVWGARCITSDSDYKYVNVRRLLIFLEDSIDRGLQWVVFEPNAEELWARVRRSIVNFLTTVWRNGALEGTKPDQGFFVKCDRTTMTQSDIDSGRLIVVIGVAPVKPAEFVIIRIGLWTADATS